MNHVMLDIETMGTRANAAITTIGAVKFDPISGLIGDTFYRKVSLEDSIKCGLEIDPSTLIWWMGQGDKARKECVSGRDPLKPTLEAFSNWVNNLDVRLWGNGAAFDNTILGNAYDVCGLTRPWKFWNDRCYRTMKNIHKDVPFERVGTHHNALDDAISQAQHLITIFKSQRDVKESLLMAQERIQDMLEGDDGQAWKEAEKYLELHKVKTV